jgi:Putative DNA-binding domain
MPSADDERLVAQALGAVRESRRVEFTRAFSGSADDWCGLVKEVAAMANSGGGAIVVGVEHDGSASGCDVSELLNADSAVISKTFAEYAGEPLEEFAVREARKGGQRVAVIVVRPRIRTPIVLDQPRGTIYFRHGAKTEAGSARDIGRFIEREVQRQRRGWVKNVRKVAAAPSESQVLVVPPKVAPSTAVTGVRVVDDPDAPAVARTDFDLTHPYRQTEVVTALNAQLGGNIATRYDVQCVRKAHSIDERPEFFHRPKFGSPQYSDAFVAWLRDEYRHDAAFFEKAKAVVQAARRRQEQARHE